MPERAEWDAIKTAQDGSRIARVIKGIERIEAAGGEVMVGAADTGDLDSMRALVKAGLERFGDINGVIHAAGISGSTPIGLKTAADVDGVLLPKIQGLAVIEQIFADRALDFLALFSSTSAIWGNVGQADYAAANAYLDAYAVAHAEGAQWPVVSINWDNWREVGMAVNTLRAAPGQAKPRQLKVGLSTAQGIRALAQALVSRHPQVIARAETPQRQPNWRRHGGPRAPVRPSRPGSPRSPRPTAIPGRHSPRRSGHRRPRWNWRSVRCGPSS